MHIVICGGGAVGAATAYELAKRGVNVSIVERWRPGGAASGKSGGFLAQDWCDGTPVDALARRSFDLHSEWADVLGNPYGYRRVDTFSAALSLRRSLRTTKSDIAGWLTPDAAHRQILGTTETTAQLDPQAFTETLISAAVDHGATCHIATAAELVRSADGDRVTGVVLADGEVIEADGVVLALGPWSPLAAQWLALPPVYGLKGHSIVFHPETAFPPEAIFAQVEDEDGNIVTPEIIPRTDGTLYVCGLSGTEPLPVDPASVVPEPGGCETLRDITIRLVPSLADAELIVQQACFRPVTADGLPVIGPVSGVEGVYVATGHSVWGMLNAPGTGEAVADLITAGTPAQVDLAPFAPSRLPPMGPDELRLAMK